MSNTSSVNFGTSSKISGQVSSAGGNKQSKSELEENKVSSSLASAKFSQYAPSEQRVNNQADVDILSSIRPADTVS